LNLRDVHHVSIYDKPDVKVPKGLINIGQVVIISGTWNEIENCIDGKTISLPFTAIQKKPTVTTDIHHLLQMDSFGSFSKVNRLLKEIA
jgi:hypothetical protein